MQTWKKLFLKTIFTCTYFFKFLPGPTHPNLCFSFEYSSFWDYPSSSSNSSSSSSSSGGSRATGAGRSTSTAISRATGHWGAISSQSHATATSGYGFIALSQTAITLTWRYINMLYVPINIICTTDNQRGRNGPQRNNALLEDSDSMLIVRIVLLSVCWTWTEFTLQTYYSLWWWWI